MIINVSELKQRFQIDHNKHDHILLPLIKSAQDLAESYADTVLEATDITEYHDGRADDHILTRNVPLNSVASLYDDQNRQWGSETLIDPSSYVFEPSGKISLIYLVFFHWKQNVKVTYNAGYVTIPNDLKVAVANLAFADYLEGAGGVNVIVGQDFIYKPKKLRDNAYQILDGYRRFGGSI